MRTAELATRVLAKSGFTTMQALNFLEFQFFDSYLNTWPKYDPKTRKLYLDIFIDAGRHGKSHNGK